MSFLSHYASVMLKGSAKLVISPIRSVIAGTPAFRNAIGHFVKKHNKVASTMDKKVEEQIGSEYVTNLEFFAKLDENQAIDKVAEGVAESLVFSLLTWSAWKGIQNTVKEREKDRAIMLEDCERIMDVKIEKSESDMLNVMDIKLKGMKEKIQEEMAEAKKACKMGVMLKEKDSRIEDGKK